MDDAGPNRRAALLHRLGQPAGHALHAHRLVIVAAKIFLEGDVTQQMNALAKGLFLVRLPEEAGIVEARAQNAFVAVPDQSFGVASRVEHGQKMGQQFPVGIVDGEIFLVVAHHRDQDLFRQIEKFRIEAAEDDRGKFREIDDRRDQRLVLAPAGSGDAAGGGIERLADHLFAFGCAQYLCGAQGFDVGAGLGDGDDAAASNNAMSARNFAGGNTK